MAPGPDALDHLEVACEHAHFVAALAISTSLVGVTVCQRTPMTKARRQPFRDIGHARFPRPAYPSTSRCSCGRPLAVRKALVRHGIERRSPGLPPGTGRAPLKLDAADLIERRTRGESISSIALGSQRSAGPPAAEKTKAFTVSLSLSKYLSWPRHWRVVTICARRTRTMLC